jgi:hypothetical protein
VRGRIPVQDVAITRALPPDERAAVLVLEVHLWERYESKHNSLDTLDDGTVTTFLTVDHVQRILRRINAHKKGEKFAAEILKTILPELGLVEDTGQVKKPRARPNRGGTNEGGRHAQPSLLRSRWWRVYALPTFSRYLGRIAGAYRGEMHDRHETAFLSASLLCQQLIPARRRPSEFKKGSVQAAFWATGPP